MAKPVTTVLGTSDIASTADRPTHYVDWGAILAGAFLAAAISSIFLAFGSAVGLSLVSPVEGNAAPPLALLIAAGLWLIWVQVSGFMGGAYLAGRMRRRIGDAAAHEVEMRDGCHGLLVWAVGVVIAGLLAGWAAVSGISGLASMAGNAAGGAAGQAMDYYADTLLRSGDPAAQQPAAGTAPVAAAEGDRAATRGEITRILGRSATAMSEGDTAYLTRLISQQTGLPEAEARQRLDQTVASMRQAAETARKTGILLAFLTAASLLVSAVAAWWAATMGGKHRDEGVDYSRFTNWR